MRTYLSYLFSILSLLSAASYAYAQEDFSIKKKTGFSNAIIENVTKVKRSKGPQSNSNSRIADFNHSNKNFKALFNITEDTTQTVRFLESSYAKSNARKQGKHTMTDIVSFVERVTPELKTSRLSSFELIDGTAEKAIFQQKYMGIPWYGSEIAVIDNSISKKFIFIGSYTMYNHEIDTAFDISTDAAIKIAKDHAAGLGYEETEYIKEHDKFHRHETQILKVIYPIDQNNAVIAYKVDHMPNALAPLTSFVHGKTGEILHFYSTLCSMDGEATANATDLNGVARRINTLSQNNSFFLVDITKPMFDISTSEGAILTYDGQNTEGEDAALFTSSDNTWADASSVSAHFNAGVAYDYFFNNHDRNSINGQGGDIISLVNIADEDGGSLENAFWNGQAIFYGNGGRAFKPLAGSLDVAGHEMTHGVVQNTANLEYQGESGAINESMADIFGFMMDQEDWQIGEDIVNTAFFPNGALRDLENPRLGNQPDNVQDQFFGERDNGGVHINSGIPNHAFHLLATQIGNRSAANIFYRALRIYLTRFSQFVDLRMACEQSADDLFGENSTESQQTSLAFEQVGIVEQDVVVIDNELPVPEGDERLLSVDTNLGERNTLFQSTADAENFIGLSQSPIINRPSITRDGREVYFISDDSAIYKLNTADINNPKETLVDNRLRWSNVAVSKDGKRLAAVTAYQDTSIYVLDIASDTWFQFELYNPTFTQGIEAEGPVYADALEWDFTGTSVLYDAFNTLGEGIEYWDVNFIEVWDTTNNSFGSGQIEKLFASLPDDVNIGNPSYSKTSPVIIAFDFLNAQSNAILAVNIETNELNLVSENNTLGFPNYSNQDDRIAFARLTSQGSIVGAIGIDETGINANTQFRGLINNAKWPIFYIESSVVTSTHQEQPSDTFSPTLYPNPTTGMVTLSDHEKVSNAVLYSNAGKVLKIWTTAKSVFDLSEFDSGTYILVLAHKKTSKAIRISKL